LIAVQISRFDPIDGPKPTVFYSDKMVDETIKERVADLLDSMAHGSEAFVHSFEGGKIYSINKMIDIKSQQARGKKESLLASVILDHQPSEKLREFVEEKLQFLEQDINANMPDLAMIFYLHRDVGDEERAETFGIYNALLTQIQMLHYEIHSKKIEVPPYEDYLSFD